MRLMFKKNGGALGETNSVAWMFDRVGLVTAKKTGSFDPEEEAIEVGANEVEKLPDTNQPTNPGQSYDFLCDVTAMDSVREQLGKRGWSIEKSELSYKTKNPTKLTESQMKEVAELLNDLDDHDDTHRVHASV
jgi:transcriptional/translational regulatory protein YebC/TACO1